MDVRLQTMPFDFDGKHFELCCNMNVLADVQEAYNGNILAALRNPGSMRAAMRFLTAMLNDYADSMCWDISYSEKQVGRMIAGTSRNVSTLCSEIGSFIRKSLTAKDPADGKEEPPKN